MHNVVITGQFANWNFWRSAKNVTPVELAVPVLQEAVKRGGRTT